MKAACLLTATMLLASLGAKAEGESPFRPDAPRDLQEAAGLVDTGLRPVFPEGAGCPPVASYFAARARYDGSPRGAAFFGGFHSGMDISCREGRPLLALADGTVMHKLAGGRMVGNRVVFQHAPADTGLPVWLYSTYQHMVELPDLEVGQRVKMGQEIGHCGRTGTQGGHYGDAGYPHLHLGMTMGETADYLATGKSASPVNGRFVDPVAVFAGKGLDNHVLAALPETAKAVSVPFKAADGRLVPEGTRLVWPFACGP